MTETPVKDQLGMSSQERGLIILESKLPDVWMR